MTEAERVAAAERPHLQRSPARPLPPGACDCHTHISDVRFPTRRSTGYKPSHAPAEAHRAMREAVGLDHSLFVQLMAYGDDNGALLRALAETGSAARGIAELPEQVSDAELAAMQAAGIVGLRFYLEMPISKPGLAVEGVSIDRLVRLGPLLRELGWLAEISATGPTIAELAPTLERLGVPIVFEHLAGFPAALGAGHPALRRLLDQMRSGAFWVKLSICHMGAWPDYADVRPVHDAFVAAVPDRLLWSSDYPHIGMGAQTPDSGHLLDVFDDWLDHDDRLRHMILADNPARLFGF